MDNANEAIYIGVYAIIFVLALSLSIFLYSSLMDYVDDAYEYIHTVSDDALVVETSVNRHLILTGQEVISYYYNYIKKDRYSDTSSSSNIILTINLNTSNEEPSYLSSENLTYKQLVDKINLTDSYILNVDDTTNSTYTYVSITKATQEELEEEW